MDNREIYFSEIETVNKIGITLKNGDKILFEDCIGNRYNSPTCVAERDITASPPYFEFFTANQPVRIIFDTKKIFSKQKIREQFVGLNRQIQKFGYSTYDLS